MKNNPFDDKKFTEIFAFPPLFSTSEVNQPLTILEKEAVKKQLDLIHISTLLEMKNYRELMKDEYLEYHNFIVPYIALMEMLKDQDGFEINEFLELITILIDLYSSFDPEFYDKYMGKIIKLASKNTIIDFYASIDNETSKIPKASFHPLQLQKIENLLNFITRFTYAKRIN